MRILTTKFRVKIDVINVTVLLLINSLRPDEADSHYPPLGLANMCFGNAIL